MTRALLIALAIAIGCLVVAGRIALHEHDAAQRLRAEMASVKAGKEADDTGLREAEAGAREREVIYVDVVREVAAAGPVAPGCVQSPAYRAAGSGVLRMRDAYCAQHPDRCAD